MAIRSTRSPVSILKLLLMTGMILLLLLLICPLVSLPLHVPLNYNEGWNAYLAMRAIGLDTSAPLYPHPGSLVFNNYPPVSFFLVGFWGYVTGDMIVAGRMVALLALLISAALVAVCLRRMGGNPVTASVAALLMALYATCSFPAYTAMDDPQWLAHAIMLGGLAILLGAPGLPPARVAIAAIVIVTGGFVKHNVIALPLAITVWLALYDRRALTVWCLTGLVTISLGFGLCVMIWGPDFLTDLLSHDRVIRPLKLIKGFEKLPEITPLLVAAVFLWKARDPDPRTHRNAVLVLLFVVIACVTGLLQRMGEGVNYNAQIETLIGACLATGLILSHGMKYPKTHKPALSLLIALAFAPLLILGPLQLTREARDLQALSGQQKEWNRTIAQLRDTPGQAACMTLSVCYWAGKEEVMDFFNLNESLVKGRQTYPLTTVLHQDHVNIIQLEPQTVMLADRPDHHKSRNLLIPAFKAAGYVPSSNSPDGSIFLVPTTPERPSIRPILAKDLPAMTGRSRRSMGP